MRVLLRVPLGSTSGYGRDGIGITRTLLQRGHDVAMLPTEVEAPIDPEILPVLTVPKVGTYDIELCHVPPIAARPKGFSPVQAKRRVLWTMWEWYTFPESVQAFNAAKEFIKTYDDVVGYTDQTIDVLSPFLGPNTKTHVLQGGMDVDLWGSVEDDKFTGYAEEFPHRRNARDTFRFAMVGVLAARKNPYIVIKAFNNLKARHGDAFDAELLLKTTWPVIPKTYDAPGVVLVDEDSWTDHMLRQFYWDVDCVINCAWGEGKDLPALEATLCGTPTILNDTPGHAAWNHPGIQKLVPTTRMFMDPEYEGRFTSVEDIENAMWDMYTHRRQAYDNVRSNALRIRRNMNWDAKVEKLGSVLGLPL